MTIAAIQLKQQTYLLDKAIKEDMQVTKRDRPFVVIDKSLAKNALLENKINLPLDFENLLQNQCAMASECNLVVTNDKKCVEGEVKHLSLVEALKII